MSIYNYLKSQVIKPCPCCGEETPYLDLVVKNDDHQYPRKFWFKISCSCGIMTDQFIVSKQGDVEPDQVRIGKVIKLWNNRVINQ